MPRNAAAEGVVWHARAAPRHAFRYRVWYVLADAERLAELPFRGLPLGLRSRDLVPGGDIVGYLGRQVAGRGLPPAAGPVMVLAQPRAMGIAFNPVVFFFCYHGDALAYVVADINNTPWNERFAYVLDVRGQESHAAVVVTDKVFHVSPFLGMAGAYRWQFRCSERRILIDIRLDGFVAGMDLALSPLTRGAAIRGAWGFPVQSAWTLLRIYWQAARLALRRTPFHPHPKHLQASRRSSP